MGVARRVTTLRSRRSAARVAPAFAVAFAAATFGASGAAPAQPEVASDAAPKTPKDEAIERFQRGLDLDEEGDHAAALVEFRRAYELAPTYKVLFNIGQLCFQLQDYACAFRSFESYLRDGGKSISTQRREAVERDIAKLSTRVATIEIVTAVAGAEVFVDDVAIGRTPLAAPALVAAGRRKIVATAKGRVADTRLVDIAGTDSIRIELALPLDRDANSAGDAPRVRRIPPKMTRASWVGVGAAGIFAASAAVTGVVALNASNQLRETNFVGDTPSAEMRSLSTRVKTYGTLSDVALGASIVTLAATLAITFLRAPTLEEVAPPRVAFDGTGIHGVF